MKSLILLLAAMVSIVLTLAIWWSKSVEKENDF